MEPTTTDRSEALAAVESSFSGFMTRAALPRLRQRITEAVGGGIDFGSFPMLARIATWGPLRTSDLAERMGLDVSTVSRRTADLEEAGLVRRTPDPDDRRAHLLDLTARGARMLARLREARGALLQEALAAWSTDEIRVLADSLGRFTSALADLA